MKKIVGVLFFIGAALILIGAAGNGQLFRDMGSAPATYGKFIGLLIPVVLYVISGIFLLGFDKPTQIGYKEGFQKRSRQVPAILPLIIAYILLLQFAFIGAFGTSPENLILACVLAAFPYMIPMAFFIGFYQIYAMTHHASKKYFANSEAALNEYLSAEEHFEAQTEDGLVLASQKALFFPQLFCMIPFDRISSVKLYKQLGEKGIYIHFDNGKKVYIPTRHFERVQEVIFANTAIRQ